MHNSKTKNECKRFFFIYLITIFFVVPAVLTVYFIVAAIGKNSFASEWYVIKYMGGWFHYAKLYAATIGCIGFIFLVL